MLFLINHYHNRYDLLVGIFIYRIIIVCKILFFDDFKKTSMILDRQKFINDLANNPRSVLSPMDGDIQRNCDSLVRALPSSPDMMDSKGNSSLYFDKIS